MKLNAGQWPGAEVTMNQNPEEPVTAQTSPTANGVIQPAENPSDLTSPAFEPASPDESSRVSEGPGLLVDVLARLPHQAILDEARLAAILNVSTRTIRRMVIRDELPPPFQFAGRSAWLTGRILVHVNAAADKAQQEHKRQSQKLRTASPYPRL